MMETPKPLGEVRTTPRGFQKIEFKDRYGVGCSIQQSSAIDDTERGRNQPGSSSLWLGIEDGDPHIMASKAAENGIKTDKTVGWVPYPIPDDVLIRTRMLLCREQVAQLIDVLQNWLASGKLDK